jgi:hypothetical protein
MEMVLGRDDSCPAGELPDPGGFGGCYLSQPLPDPEVTSMQLKRPFFIVGSGRSGTTLLQMMLSGLPGLHVTGETQFLHCVMKRRGKLGALAGDEGFENALAEVRRVARWFEIDADIDALIGEMRERPREYGALFDALLAHVQRRHPDCRRLGEKTPQHLKFVGELLAWWPDAQVINCTRDGRDVALSFGKAMGLTTLQVALMWRRDQRLHQRYADTFGADRYTSVRFEELVSDPEAELRRISAWLGEEYDDGALEYHRRKDRGYAAFETHKANTFKPVMPSRKAAWKQEMAPGDLALFQALAGPELEAGGYELAPAPRLKGALLALPQALKTGGRRVRYWRGDLEPTYEDES